MTPVISIYCLGIIALICLPDSTSSQRNDWQGSIEKRKVGSCKVNEFQCENGACIESDKVCDGLSQCADASDENPKACEEKASSTSRPPLAKDCGKFNPKPTPLQNTRGGEGSWLPWFATIYMKQDDDSFKYMCSGSLVSHYEIISGATCVLDLQTNKLRDPSSFKVIVGRYNMRKPTPTEQQFEVKAIHVPSNFKGQENNFHADISLLVLKDKVEFNGIVQPICLDLEGMYTNFLTPGKLGTIGSWGGDARYMNATLSIHSVPYVGFKTCEENVPATFLPFLTYDKFCSGIIGVNTICRGDSGGGFATQFRDGKWYLTGLISVGVPAEGDCNSHNYHALTKVSEYYDFIEKNTKGDPQISGDTDGMSAPFEPDIQPSSTRPPPPPRPASTTFRPESRPTRPATRPPPPPPPRPTYFPPQSTHRPTRPTSELPLPVSEFEWPNYCKENFLCQSRECVSSSVVCNGVKDCEDGSDEDQCAKTNSSLSCSYSPSVACKLPKQPENGQYSLIGCQALGINRNPGNMVPVGVALAYECDPDYKLSGSSVLVCNNDWTSDPPTCSKILCPPLSDPSRDIDCILNSEDVDCMGQGEPGTRASLRCKTHFENVPTLSTYDMACQRDGKWSRELHSCVPKCGEPNPHGVTLIGNGTRSKRSEYPWHIGLYKFQKDNSLSLHCSGTLVSSRVIVTAAHCFPEDTARNMENVMSQYRAVAGKYYRDWSSTSKYTQHLDLQKLVLHRRYRGGSRNYVHDIAVAVLKYQVRIDEAVRPVCVDYDKSFFKYFTPGISGTVLGWGWTENQTWSEAVLTAKLPYVSQVECEENTPASFHDFLLGDKFCAGKDKTVVCQGDSGGGYAVKFPHSSRWYLAGVVSIGATEECAIYPYAAFTSIYSNLEFIRQYVDQYI